MLCEKIEQQIWQKQQEQQISQNSTLRKTKGQEGLREVRKNLKSNKNCPCYVRRFSNKQAEIARITNLTKSALEREKIKKGFERFANFAKIAKERSRTYFGR